MFPLSAANDDFIIKHNIRVIPAAMVSMVKVYSYAGHDGNVLLPGVLPAEWMVCFSLWHHENMDPGIRSLAAKDFQLGERGEADWATG